MSRVVHAALFLAAASMGCWELHRAGALGSPACSLHSAIYRQPVDSSALAGNASDSVPLNTFALWNKYQLSRKWGVGLGIIYQDEWFAAADNLVVVPDFTRVDAPVYYAVNEHRSAQDIDRQQVWDLIAQQQHLLQRSDLCLRDAEGRW